MVLSFCRKLGSKTNKKISKNEKLLIIFRLTNKRLLIKLFIMFIINENLKIKFLKIKTFKKKDKELKIIVIIVDNW